MNEWKSGFVEANGIRLHYTRTGGDAPPLVLAHGVTDAGLCWSPVAAALAQEFDVIMVDARGHGKSDAPERGYGPVEQADDLAGAIAALGLERPAVLGHSMGAATALVLAGAHPEAPGAILLEDPPAWWTGVADATAHQERRREMRERAAAYQRRSRAELIADKDAEQSGWSADELGPWADAKLQFSPNVLSVYESENAAEVDWTAILPRITCPVLLIMSDPERGGIVTDETAAALRELIPQLEVVHIPEAGHNIRRDQFDRYMEVVRGFLGAYEGVSAT
ncbi:MAG: alpha/beta hydrolase [Chloroflexia bacterium]|nr:alpha/beta hydrolase [Chloroflexia bacterium]